MKEKSQKKKPTLQPHLRERGKPKEEREKLTH